MRRVARSFGLLAFAAIPVACAVQAPPVAQTAWAIVPEKPSIAPCPEDMVLAGQVCIDRYEAYVVELDAAGHEKPHSPYEVVARLRVKAKNAEGQVPQAYISQVQAGAACQEAGKRLCAAEEFTYACSGGDPLANDYPYGGHEHQAGACNEGKGSQMYRFFGSNPRQWTFDDFNDPRLNQTAGGLAKSGQYPKCVSPFGVHDCVGNLHEWGADPPDANGLGRFRGGFYGDAEVNGHGCKYVTRAHGPTYHDYSTGFRCCADPSGQSELQAKK
jgi:sulfatase modifying factor 1